MYINETRSFTIPTYEDPEGHTPYMTISALPAWITKSGNDLIISPTDYSSMGVTTITFYLSDSHRVSTHKTEITVNNRPPYYLASHVYPSISVHLNFMETVAIPPFQDPEGYQGKVTVEDTHPFPIATNVNSAYSAFTVSPVLFQ
jgi:hypothetical protein